MKAFPLYEGSYTVDASKKFVPFDPLTQDPKSRKGSLFVHIYPFLIETAEDLILLDTGLGHLDENGELLLHSNIRKAGYEPSQVSKIVMSHLHSDHSLGLVIREGNSFRLSFPDATLYVQKQELETSLLDVPSTYPGRQMSFVKDHAKIILLEGAGKIGPEIYYEHSGGHCPYHQVVHVDSGSDYFFFGGDEMPESSALIHNYIAKYDYDGRKTRDLRIKYGHQAAEEGWTCLFYHDFDGHPACKVGLNADGSFRLIPVS
jgi:glyoxylase-like metal-dependent hydrolase (beta-lactamase superfamily II)